MKNYVLTFTVDLVLTENIKAINSESAVQLAEMIAHKRGLKFISLAETIDMNKFLCTKKESS